MTTLLYTHPDCLDHVTPPGHPEQVARLKAVEAALAAPEFDALDRREAPLGTRDDLLLAHPASHVDKIRDAAPKPDERRTQLDSDTSMSAGSWQAAHRAVGGAIAAVDAVLAGEAANAFVACRPPGHHAEKTRPMGFCLFSNVAIAALHALNRRGVSRVAVLDFDVHHGNGTQDILWEEPRALFASSHQVPLFPGSGAADEIGSLGQILNVPLGEGTGGEVMRRSWDRRILPRVEDFAPEVILVSAGFDAHRADPLAGLDWETADFGWLAHRICDTADRVCGGRVVSCLEGGYDLEALAESVAIYVEAMMERGEG